MYSLTRFDCTLFCNSLGSIMFCCVRRSTSLEGRALKSTKVWWSLSFEKEDGQLEYLAVEKRSIGSQFHVFSLEFECKDDLWSTACHSREDPRLQRTAILIPS